MENTKTMNWNEFKYKQKYKENKNQNDDIILKNFGLPLVILTTSLDSSMQTITGSINNISFWMRMVGCSIAVIAGTKRTIGCFESGNRQKAISILIDTGVIVACMFMLTMVVDVIKTSMGG